MTGIDWLRAKELFLELAELDEGSRRMHLNVLAQHESELADQVRSLLRHDTEGLSPTVAAGALAKTLDQAQDRLWAQRRLGRYRLKKKLGQGGMGVVYLAERADREFEKEVALKVLPLGLDTPLAIDRFRRERQILAMLEHPAIARLLDGGTTDDGLPFLMMEYAPGLPITDYCEQQRLPIRQRIKLLLEVCAAVSFANANLVVHQDLKPSNILVDAGGKPKLLDFGIAKLLDDPAAEQTQVLALTPGYASPEQHAGGPITTASDVYSLGVLLGELLTGQRPRTANPHDSLAPYSLTAKLSGDLDSIVDKALRENPAERYGSVDRLAGDLRRYLAGQPVEARPPTFVYHAGKFLRRHRWAASTAIAFASLLVAFSVSSLLQARATARQRDRAEAVSDLLTEAFLQADPSHSRRGDVSAREILAIGSRMVRRKLRNEPQVMAEMLHTIGSVQSALGLYQEATTNLDEAGLLRRQLSGDDSASSASTELEQARLHYFRANFDLAEEIARRAAGKLRRYRSPAVAEATHLIADIVYSRGDKGARDRGVALHLQALAENAALLGEDSLQHAEGLCRLAGALGPHGQRQEAAELYRQSLSLLNRLAPPSIRQQPLHCAS